MEHIAALSSWLVPVLLSIIGGGILGVCWLLKKTLENNERDHTTFYSLINKHESLLVEHGVRLKRVESEVEYISHNKVAHDG